MEIRGSREKILNSIRESLAVYPPIETADAPGEGVFHPINESLAVSFAQELQKINGQFVFCMNDSELVDNLLFLFEQRKWESVHCTVPEIQTLLTEAAIPFEAGEEALFHADASLTYCKYLVARTGTVVVSAKDRSMRKTQVLAPVHIVIGKTSQIVEEVQEAVSELQTDQSEYVSFSLITGPSRTADIEKTLVLGAHGPKELYVFLVNDNMNI